MHRGYVKVWRKIQDSGLMQMPNTLALFMYVLLNATHKDTKVGTTTGVIELKRGQYISGRKTLALNLKQSEREIRTSLDRLMQLEILTIKTTNKYSIYTIENYDNYQGSDQETTNKSTIKRPSNDQQTTTKQELKNERTKDVCVEVLEYLNAKANKKFQPVKSNISLIQSRLNDGFLKEDLIRVIDNKCAQWIKDEKMNQYLRPETLFGATKFAQYSGETDYVEKEEKLEWK